MSVPAISLHSIPPGNIFPADLDLNPRPLSSSTHRAIAGGLSYLFSSPSSRSPVAVDELSSHRCDDLSCSFSYSTSSSHFKTRDHSPVSVLHGAVSCSSGSCSLPQSIRVPFGDWKFGKDRNFSKFVRNAQSSCLDYDSPSFRVPGNLVEEEELMFSLEESLPRSCEPYALRLLAGAQSRHVIFHEEIVVKAFYEAEKAHRGQIRASGDPICSIV